MLLAKSPKETDRYSGNDNLEIMVDAKNYNQFLTSSIIREIVYPKVIVDFGAGIGTFADELIKKGFHVHGIEPDPFQLKALEQKGIPASASLKEFGNNSIDLIYSLNVLEHIEDDVSVLEDWHGKLKTGGKALIYVPAFKVLYSSMDEKVGHLRRYTIGELSEKVVKAGFSIEKCRYVDSIGFFAALFFKFFGNKGGDINREALIFYDRFLFPVSLMIDIVLNKIFGKNIMLVASKTGD